ncbi:MAG: hypothetical protein RTV72_05815 [Candidatus Thorarchaeota archaeon]
MDFKPFLTTLTSMNDGDICELCSVVYGVESIVRYNPVGRSNFRFQCEGNNRDNLIHKFTIDGKLYRKTKRIKNSRDCPVCGYPTSILSDPKTGASCHMCDASFRLEGNIVILTDLGKFTKSPDWFEGEIKISESNE